MTDIVDRARDFIESGDSYTGPEVRNAVYPLLDEIERLRSERDAAELMSLALKAEVERLNKCVQYEQHRADRIGTHGLECWKWGPTHYECALAEVERLTMALNRIAERTSSDDPCRHLVQIARDATRPARASDYSPDGHK